jgi:hypothetical protein
MNVNESIQHLQQSLAEQAKRINPKGVSESLSSILEASLNEAVVLRLQKRINAGQRFLRAIPFAPRNCEHTVGKGCAIAFCFALPDSSTEGVMVVVMKADGETVDKLCDPATELFVSSLEPLEAFSAHLEGDLDSPEAILLPPTGPTTPTTKCRTFCGPEGREVVNDAPQPDD